MRIYCICVLFQDIGCLLGIFEKRLSDSDRKAAAEMSGTGTDRGRQQGVKQKKSEQLPEIPGNRTDPMH